ncbi:MAG: PTS sugar transporter subunit IIA [Candidatus Cloacimonetes bacterium]|nr:PTS sugar transporter subunit IIA [Candidatus Cloacimonadota bacterium]
MEISEILKVECCETDFNANSKLDALKKIAEILKKSEHLASFKSDTIYEKLLERENKGSTGFSNGIAIPHGQLEGLQDFVIAVAISKKGIDFESLDKKKSKVFVTILGPAGENVEHLKLLAKISQALKEPSMVDELLNCSSKVSLYENFVTSAEGIIQVEQAKGKEKLLVLIVKDEKIMDDLAEIFVEFGIQEATILDADQMKNLLSTKPLFMGFFNFTGEKTNFNQIIISKIHKEYIRAVVQSIERIVGDINNYSGLSLLVLDLFYSKGF